MAEEHGSSKPAEFFVGVVDFFGIVLPGGILTFWIHQCLNYAYPNFWKNVPFPHDKWVNWAGFFVIAYVVGQLLHVVGSLCLDKVYDWWKEDPKAKRWNDLDARSVFKEITSSKLTKLAETAGISLPKGDDFNMLTVFLRIWNAGSVAEMDRLEADQKFFRGLIVVVLVIWPSFFMIRVSPDSRILAGGLLLLLGLVPFLVPLMLLKRIESKEEEKKKEEEEKFQHRGWLAALVWLLIWIVVPVGFWYYVPDLPIPSAPHLTAPPAPGELPTASPTHSTAPPASESTCRVTPNVTLNAGQTAAATKVVEIDSGDTKESPRECHQTPMSTEAVGSIALALLVSLGLMVVRFGQQRLKYTLFVYRAFLGLQFAGPSSAVAGGTAER